MTPTLWLPPVSKFVLETVPVVCVVAIGGYMATTALSRPRPGVRARKAAAARRFRSGSRPPRFPLQPPRCCPTIPISTPRGTRSSG